MMQKYGFALLFAVLVLCANVPAQPKKYPIPKDVSEQMLASVPEKDGKIFFEEAVTAAPALTKEQLHTRIRQWFTEQFAGNKSTIETDDVQKGLLAGKAAYKYTKASGLVVNSGFINFVFSAAIKDGGFRYQLSDFTTNESTNGLTGLASTGIKHTYNLEEVLKDYREGKKLTLPGGNWRI
jgi:hypothetical protein